MPIDGEAGVGYMMREGFDLPPLMFTRDEIVALVAGARMVRAFGGAAMARAAEEALVKIGAVLPDAEKDRIARTEIHAPMWVVSDADRAHIDRIERAVEKREVLTLDYRDEAGRASARDVRPLGLWFWGKVWTLVAWCEMRSDFRAFRIDRIDRGAAVGVAVLAVVAGQRAGVGVGRVGGGRGRRHAIELALQIAGANTSRRPGGTARTGSPPPGGRSRAVQARRSGASSMAWPSSSRIVRSRGPTAPAPPRSGRVGACRGRRS